MTAELISSSALLTANALLLGAVTIELLRVRRIARRLRGRPAAAVAERAGTMDTIDEGRRLLAALDERIAELRDLADGLACAEAMPRPGSEERSEPVPGTRPGPAFRRAAQLARNGANADELARACGLNRGAAELLVRLHAAAPERSLRQALSRPERPRRAAAVPAASRLRG